MTVEFTWKPEHAAGRNDCVGLRMNTHCMVASMIRDKLPDAKIRVGVDWAEIDGIKYNLPRHVVEAIRAYMACKKVNPCDFELDIA